MSEFRPISQVPWQVTRDEFLRSAAEVVDAGACCVFVIDGSIPKPARAGYAALVIAYARAEEPVCILDDGATALLVRDGGTRSGQVVAQRVLDQMRRLSLERTLRAAVVPLGDDAATSMAAARSAAEAAPPGEVVTAT
jgi:hypothetical protein